MEHKETEENAMKKYTDMSLQERQAEYAAVQVEYEKLKAMGLSLNMARGKPSKVQLPRRCLRTFWAASPSRCSWAATPACS